MIIVTATKRASTVQDVPFSINAQTEKTSSAPTPTRSRTISRNVAGLAVQNLGPGQSQVSVRGVSAGQIVRDQPGVKEQVGVYLDESVISLSLFTPDFDLFDLNRVETLRGPQGTLFGSGSVGGTIRYITNQPKLGRTEGLVEANSTRSTTATSAATSRARSTCRSATRAAVRAVGYYTRICRLHRRARAGRRQERQRRQPRRRPPLAAVAAGRPSSRSRRASSIRRSTPTASTARKSTTSTPISSPTTADGLRRARAISAAAREVQDDTLLADLTASL